MVKPEDSSRTAGVLTPGEDLSEGAPGRGGILDPTDTFVRRHLGSSEDEVRQMLETLGLGSVEELVRQTVPESIRRTAPLDRSRVRAVLRGGTNFGCTPRKHLDWAQGGTA